MILKIEDKPCLLFPIGLFIGLIATFNGANFQNAKFLLPYVTLFSALI